MISKSYVGKTESGYPVYRIASALFKETSEELKPLTDKEIKDFIESDDDFEYPNQWFDDNEPWDWREESLFFSSAELLNKRK